MQEDRKIYQFKQGIRFFDFDAVSFLVDVTGRNLFNLGRSSALIARQLNGRNNLAKVADVVQTSYRVNTAEAEKAVEKCIQMLEVNGMIEEVL